MGDAKKDSITNVSFLDSVRRTYNDVIEIMNDLVSENDENILEVIKSEELEKGLESTRKLEDEYYGNSSTSKKEVRLAQEKYVPSSTNNENGDLEKEKSNNHVRTTNAIFNEKITKNIEEKISGSDEKTESKPSGIEDIKINNNDNNDEENTQDLDDDDIDNV